MRGFCGWGEASCERYHWCYFCWGQPGSLLRQIEPRPRPMASTSATLSCPPPAAWRARASPPPKTSSPRSTAMRQPSRSTRERISRSAGVSSARRPDSRRLPQSRSSASSRSPKRAKPRGRSCRRSASPRSSTASHSPRRSGSPSSALPVAARATSKVRRATAPPPTCCSSSSPRQWPWPLRSGSRWGRRCSSATATPPGPLSASAT